MGESPRSLDLESAIFRRKMSFNATEQTQTHCYLFFNLVLARRCEIGECPIIDKQYEWRLQGSRGALAAQHATALVFRLGMPLEMRGVCSHFFTEVS
jgi:hypothetical protein